MVKAVKSSIANKLKQSVGRAGEDFVCAHIPCQTCGIRKWTNLNRENPNFPGVDLK
jgi:deoxycytidylate deaminase